MTSLYESAGVDFDSIFAPQHAGWPQAPVTNYKVAGTDLNQRYAALSTGSAAAATKYKDGSGNDLNTYFAALGSTGVQVLTQPSNVAGSAAAGSPSGVVTSNVTTVAGTKGGGTYTYNWVITITVGAGVTFTAGGSATTGVTGTVPAGQTYSGTMYCQISDGVTTKNTNASSWSLQNTSPTQVTTNFNGVAGSYNNGVGLYQGYDNGADGTAFGSINSNALSGGRTLAVVYTYSPGGGTNYIQISGFTADPGAGFLQSVTVNGKSLTGATATYSYAGGVATWHWSIATYGTFNLSSGQAYTGSITYNP